MVWVLCGVCKVVLVHFMKADGDWRCSSPIPDLSTKWGRWLVSFMPQPLSFKE